MRIALTVEGTRGDVHPMLGLGDLLCAAGHSVRLCAPPDFAEAARARGFEFEPVGPSVRAFLEEHAEAITGGGMKALAESDRYQRSALVWQFETLPDAVAGCDRVFAAGVTFGAASAAELHGLPYRYVAYCPVLFPSREHPPFILPVSGLPGWLNAAGWALMRFAFNRLTLPRLNALRRQIGLPAAPEIFDHLLEGEKGPILACDRELGPAPADVRYRVQQIPCLHPPQSEPLPEKLESFLSQGPPPLYLGFGSMTDPDPQRTTQQLLELVSQLGCRAVVSQGWAGLGGGALPSEVMSVGPVSHSALFPRCAAIVHHGGAGTTTTAARAGVPQLLVPHLLDQFYWSGRVRSLGLGSPAVRRAGLSSPALKSALGETLGNEILAERARDFGERLRAQAEPPAVESLL